MTMELRQLSENSPPRWQGNSRLSKLVPTKPENTSTQIVQVAFKLTVLTRLYWHDRRIEGGWPVTANILI